MASFSRIPTEKRQSAALLGATTVLALASCGGATEQPDPAPTQPDRPAAPERPASDPPRRLNPPPCPTGLANCREASGRIAFVERVDPDGDGDAHFVLVSSQSITAPGLTIIDVRRDLRPHPLPGVGDELAAAGPVYPGSRGQLQIEAIEVSVAD